MLDYGKTSAGSRPKNFREDLQKAFKNWQLSQERVQEEERQRRAELREREEMRKLKVIDKGLNSCLNMLERKKKELKNKELVLKVLKLNYANERKQLEEEFVKKQKLLDDRILEEATKVDLEKEKLGHELNSLEEQLEGLNTSGQLLTPKPDPGNWDLESDQSAIQLFAI